MSLYLDGDYGQEFMEHMLDEFADAIEHADPEVLAAEMRADGEDVEAIAARTKQACLDAVQTFAATTPLIANETEHPYVSFTESDACWCQPFDGPAHPRCPMHGNSK